jgi:hypothetical protein
VRPTLRTGGFEDLIRMLPEGIGVIPLCLNVRRGAIDEFKSAIPAYEEKVAELSAAGVDVINPSGAPPFMAQGGNLRGYQAKLIEFAQIANHSFSSPRPWPRALACGVCM